MENLQTYARLFNIICNDFEGGNLGKKVAQKMFYFFERFGVDLNLKYGIHYYGPYSSKLDNIIRMLESEEYIAIDTSGSTHIISMQTVPVSCDLERKHEDCAKEVVSALSKKTPLELEALATMDYVANKMGCNTKEEIVNCFIAIKGEKFCKRNIEETYTLLKELRLISA